MNSDLYFAEEDRQKFIDFLNVIAKKAKFELNTEEIIVYFKLLSHMQQRILPKIDANILEVKEVIKAKEQKNGE